MVDRGSEPGRSVVGRIQRGYATYLGWLYNVSRVVRDVSDGVRNRVDASFDVSRGVMQRIWGGSEAIRWGSEPGRCVVGRIQRAYATYPGWLYNVSRVVRDVSDGVRNRVDASLDVSRVIRDVSEGVMQRIRDGSEAIRWGSKPGRSGVGRIQRGYTTYPTHP